MAAYAALVSLLNNIKQIHNDPHLSTCFCKKQIESLGEKLCFLLDFVESCSKEADGLESQIASSAQAAEDAIESHVVHQILAASTGKNNSSLLNLEQIIQGMEFVEQKVKNERGFDDQQPTYPVPTGSSRPGKSTNTMVGFDGYLTKLLEGLTSEQCGRQTISVVGMGGLGKTTLAINAYDNLVVAQCFDVRVWVTVSQAYNVKRILFEALSCVNESTSGVDENSEEQLGEKLYKVLWGRRYLIVLDDLWSVDVWEKIQFFFPDCGDGSRIVVTTRLSDVANSLRSWKLELNLLDNDESWSLFCDKAFGEESCPLELQDIGKYLVNKCNGLPLSIVVIGGLLGKSSRTREYWESVARDTNSMLKSEKDEHCLDILSLSYSHLPAHLKPCFLYLGIFPEDHTIRASRLIKLWVAEGFLKPNNCKTLEEIAEGYLEDLVGRNLISITRWRWNGTIKYCNIHDLLRELCLRIAEKEKFLYVMKVDGIRQGMERDQRRIVICEGAYRPLFKRAMSLARSFIFSGGLMPFRFSLLRVLTRVDSDSMDAILRQVNLRYLVYEPLKPKIPHELPSSISLLWNVQTLIIKGDTERIYAPLEIWHMSRLRHVDFNEIYLPNPPPTGLVLQDLQTLANVVNFAFTGEVCKRIPNIKKLHIRYKEFSREYQTDYYGIYNLRFLHKLESLNCLFYKHPKGGCLLQNLRFPSSLQKLSLTNSYLHWEDVTNIGLSLPRLQVLKLGRCSVIGAEWNVVEGAFPCLKFLRICCEDLIYWTVEDFNFPVLEKLVLDSLVKLEEIPFSMAYLPTLRYLRLYSCSVSAAISSTKILEEQMNYGYEDLEVRVKFKDTEEEESFKENAEMLESYSSKNFQHTTTSDFLDLLLIAPRSTMYTSSSPC